MIRVADQISFWNGKIYVSIGYYASHLQHVFLHSAMSVAFGVYSAGRWIEFQHSTVRYDIDSVRMTQINVEPVIWAPVDANTSSSTVTILGVVVNSSLTATDHNSYLLDSCSSLLCALRVLRTWPSRSVTERRFLRPSRSVTERRFLRYGDRQDDVPCTGIAWILFGFWSHTIKLISAPRC